MTRTLIALFGITALIATGCKPEVPEDTAPPEDTTPPVDNDQDDDGIIDVHEDTNHDGNLENDDPDGDGLGNAFDTDSDGDGIPDATESGDTNPDTLPFDTDEDAVPDYLDLDADGNAVLDAAEAQIPATPVDTDGDGTADFQDLDNDGDQIKDSLEITIPGAPYDTDLDGTKDYMDLDSDADGLCDAWEGGTTSWRDEPIDSDIDGTADYRDTDSDNDGVNDSAEGQVEGTCGEPGDIDNDGRYNSADNDSDGDGLSDEDERDIHGTDPFDGDSDGDGNSDGAELKSGTDPLDSESIIEGLYVEVQERTTTEQTFEFEPKIQYGDIAMLVDTTCSMSSTLTAAKDRYSELVTELSATFENVAFSFATFDDYPYGSMGSAPDKPFELRQQTTTDESDMQAALAAASIHNGADGQESTVEALYQAITGEGYDLDCNGTYDAAEDVKPFIESSTDPFKGKQTGFYDSTVTGTGTRGGMGFRDYSLPIIIYATDIYIRDADSTDPSLAAVPGGCPQDAGHGIMYTALDDLGGYIIGMDVSSYGATSPYSPYSQMITFSQDTGSLADLDGDGDADDELVFSVPMGGASFGADFKKNVVNAVEQLVAAVEFNKVSLEVVGDDYSMIQSIDPEYYEGIDYEAVDTLDFTLTFLGTVAASSADQVFNMKLLVIGDDTILLDELDIVVVVPGTSE